MSKTGHDDGGPAFPVPSGYETAGPALYPGMTLRDYFAGQALAGMCSYGAYRHVDGKAGIVADAYEIADAMISERTKQ